MHILLIVLTLHIPGSHSLKDKRRHIKSLKDRIASRFNASVSEVGELEQWQHSELAICMVSNDKVYLDKQYKLIEQLATQVADIEITRIQHEWL